MNYRRNASIFTRLSHAVAISALYASHAFAAEQPNAGTLQQQIKPVLPATPSKQGTALPDLPAQDLQDNTPFEVKKIIIDGNASIASAELYALVKDYEGANHTISDMQQACKRITDYYRAHGFPLARAILPQQEISAGEVRIQVIEAKFGNVHLDNQSAVSDDLVNSTLKPFSNGVVITQQALDHTLLLVSDLPGVTVGATVKAGELQGTSDFDIALQAKPSVEGRIGLDDFGNRFINRPRLSGSINLINPLHHGDIFSIDVLTTGERMQYGQLSYDITANGLGTHVGGTYSHLRYRLGDSLQSLRVNGWADMAEAWVKHPFIRSRNYNLYGTAKYQFNQLRDRTDSTNIKNDRTLNTALISINGDWRDGLLGGGLSSYQLGYAFGDVDFDDAVAKATDAAAANTQGRFGKINYNLNRLQSLGEDTQLWASLIGQAAQDNLDASQKMVVGGPYSVRAYDNGAISGDNGALLTVELRHVLSRQWGVWQGIAFVDTAWVEVNDKSLPARTGANSANLSGAGLGINWSNAKQWQAKAFAATSINDANILVRDADNTIIWVELAKYF